MGKAGATNFDEIPEAPSFPGFLSILYSIPFLPLLTKGKKTPSHPLLSVPPRRGLLPCPPGLPSLLDPNSHIRRHQGRHTPEPQHPPDAVVVGLPARLLRDAEDDAAHERGEELGRRHGDVVQAEHDAGLVLVGPAGLPGLGVALGDLGGDEREGGPEGHGPAEARDADHDGGAGRGVDDECGGHAEGEKEVREKPGATEGEPGDLSEREEVG